LANYSFEEKLRSATQHHELIAAFEAGDPSWAAATMRGHVLGAYWALARSLSLSKAPAESAPASKRPDGAGRGGDSLPSSMSRLRREAARKRIRPARPKNSTPV
jgi:hypothetical protein